MLKGTFRLGGDLIEVVIEEDNILFNDVSSGTITTIEGIKISHSGVVKQFPDLEEDKEWRKKAIERFKEHIKKLPSEIRKLDYIKNELTKYGYTPCFYQRAGFRPMKFK